AGAYGADEDTEGVNFLADAGAAYLYQKQADGQWLEIAKLTASDREAGDWFGFSVAIDYGHCSIGAFGEDGPDSGAYPLPNAGAVYVFENDQLSASTAVVGEPFVRLFPVPVHDHLQIVLPEDSSAHAALYDMQGRLLDEMTFSGSTSLPMVLYGQGLYVLCISYGNQLGVKRVIKY
ncbi:MAG TPA: T9SS type A sorting domain-containing protein, partial [Phaeodactylibacter sp.]|nr:T9SS type A sorting domain-containing protein [Phaeodactylibacter sp.]